MIIVSNRLPITIAADPSGFTYETQQRWTRQRADTYFERQRRALGRLDRNRLRRATRRFDSYPMVSCELHVCSTLPERFR
jgi:hypothetical protein